MEAVLHPGMRLMRRLSVPGKFVVIGLLLLLPLSVSVAGGWLDSSGQIDFAQRERAGLSYARPLIHLITQLGRMDAAAQRAVPTRSVSLTAIADIEAADIVVGEQLGVSGRWTSLRRDAIALTRSEQATPSAITRVARATSALLTEVANDSYLILDPQLDSYYLVIALVEGQTRLIQAATTLNQLTHLEVATSHDDLDRAVALRDLSEASRQLNLDLATAQRSTEWSGLAGQISAPLAAVRSAVGGYSNTYTSTYSNASSNPSQVDAPALHRRGRDASAGTVSTDLATLSASAQSLTNVLAQSLDTLLAQRLQRLSGSRLSPVLGALSALAIVTYLLVALYRATTRDVRSVLEEINTVTAGAVHQSDALTGRDEFAQMSRAVVYARDRLTSLLGELRYQAMHDELTFLANRRLFTEKLDEALRADRSGASNGRVAAVLIDLEGFKDVNDSFGHGIGDRLLRAVGVRFHHAVRRRNLVARLGGDEFAVLVTDVRNHRDVEQVAQRLAESLERPIDLDGRLLHVRASIGIVLADARATSLEVMRNADVALNAARDQGKGKGKIVAFEGAMHDRTRERTELSGDLVQAIQRGEMSVVYQPIVDLETEIVHGVEALVRWEHPVRGPVSPEVFVPLAEASGLIVPLGRWVLGEAVRQLAQWRAAFPDAYPLSLDVNLAAAQLADPGLVEDVLSIIDESGIDPAALVLEITESDLMDDVELARRRLGQLSTMGVRLALDDFGTGYSSLSYLSSLPVEILKIDKSFLGGVGGAADGPAGSHPAGSRAPSLLRSIVALGSGLGLQMIAEGIERPEQVTVLREAGCHLGQGYLWSRPLAADDVTTLLRSGRIPTGTLPRPRTRSG